MVDIEVFTPEREREFITDFQKAFVKNGLSPPSRREISTFVHDAVMFQSPETHGETIFVTPEARYEFGPSGKYVAEALSHEELHRVLNRINRPASRAIDKYQGSPHQTGLTRALIRALKSGGVR